MILSNIAGFPRIGPRRELKFALESYWNGSSTQEELVASGEAIRRSSRDFMHAAGVELVPCNDFSLYDHMLDMIVLTGAVPPRYQHKGGAFSLDTYFAMARGRGDVPAMDMTKWFNTNYHYIVPELSDSTELNLHGAKPVHEHQADMEDGINSVPVVVGPLSFLLLSKPEGGDRLGLMQKLLPVYQELFGELAKQGTEWIQLDEPCLVQDRTEEELDVFKKAYRRLGANTRRPKILVKTYFDQLGETYKALRSLPVEGIGVDLAAGAPNAALVAEGGKLAEKTLFAGIVDGHNVWINDLDASLKMLQPLADLAEDLAVSTSCSLLHVPLDAEQEPGLDAEVAGWVAFARQKVKEVVTLARGLSEGPQAVAAELEANQAALKSRRTSARTANAAVRQRLESATAADTARFAQYPHRRRLQTERLGLPPLPTTAIGSFPQTPEIRKARARLAGGELTTQAYAGEMRAEVARVVEFQERIGLDVLVHGEPERNDMVQYFAEQLEGFVVTANAWVQSYGSRCVRPPIIVGDVWRPSPMTVEWFSYAQSLTAKPVKGMLTGPVTMLMWSFVRDDQPRSETAKQIALAIRDEVCDLEAAGARVIQVDEPAIREGLPLRAQGRDEYLAWAVYCFRLATAVVKDETQIQTHMCYSDFGDIMSAIHDMDADVTLIEASRSQMELLDDFARHGYEREVGPGVYDVHSPSVPSTGEIAERLRLALKVLGPGQIWVNPDCGLKTRGWKEVEPSLANMVAAAAKVRSELSPAT